MVQSRPDPFNGWEVNTLTQNGPGIPMAFVKPPISTTSRPPGFKTFLTLVRTPKGSRLHQCNAALLKTASNFSKTSGSSSGSSSDCASATKACLTPFALAFSIYGPPISTRRLFRVPQNRKALTMLSLKSVPTTKPPSFCVTMS